MSGTVFVLKDISFEIDPREALRYMGCSADVTPDIERLLAQSIREVRGVCTPAACYMRAPLRFAGNTLDFGFMRVESRALFKNLQGCKEIFLFAATVGMGFERLLARKQLASPAGGLAVDAVGSAAIEGICNSVNGVLERQVAPEGLFLRPRFSPGYGDFSIGFQKELSQLLDTPRKIGMALTDGMMMVPTKSVTAVVGISDRPCRLVRGGCALCEKNDCPYRS